MNSVVSPLDVGRKVIEALGIKPGEAFKLSRLRNGAVLLSKPDDVRRDGVEVKRKIGESEK
jgi:hypothetical protein